MRLRGIFAGIGLVLVVACAAPAPRAAPSPTRPAPAATATPDAAATAIAIVPLRIDESPLPPVEPTPPGFTSGRATATPFATPEAAWKYVTIVFGVENRSDAPRLVGIAGSDQFTTNLASATLTGGDGTRYKPVRSSTSFGLRTATSHALTTYPVLLRLVPGFRATGESAGSLSVVAPEPTSLTFKVPANLTDYGTLSIPPLTSLGPKSGEDDVTQRLRPLIGGFQALQLSGVSPTPGSPISTELMQSAQPVGGSASSRGKVTVSVGPVEASDPEDYVVRNLGWKQITLSLQYRNDDPSQARTFDVEAWLLGEDGIVYTGDAPSIGDFGRALTPPDPASLLLWDGRAVGPDSTPPGQSLEPRRPTFLVPRALHSAILVLAGDVEATFNLSPLPDPAR